MCVSCNDDKRNNEHVLCDYVVVFNSTIAGNKRSQSIRNVLSVIVVSNVIPS